MNPRFSRALAGTIGIACSVVLAAAGASATGSAAAPANEQHAEAHTDQEARSNTGRVRSFDVVVGDNDVAQAASSTGGDATNGNSATNTSAGSAGIATGNGGAGNSSSVSGSQAHNTPAPVAPTKTQKANAVVVETAEPAAASSEQHIDVQTTQLATANTGDNLSVSVVVGTNDTTQTATTPDGTAANTNAATNNGTSSSVVTTGDATASNSSNIVVGQASG